MLNYCGYTVGEDITLKQLDNLIQFIHGHLTPEQLLKANQEELNQIAKDNEKEWRID